MPGRPRDSSNCLITVRTNLQKVLHIFTCLRLSMYRVVNSVVILLCEGTARVCPSFGGPGGFCGERRVAVRGANYSTVQTMFLLNRSCVHTKIPIAYLAACSLPEPILFSAFLFLGCRVASVSYTCTPSCSLCCGDLSIKIHGA